ncbi:MAG: putative lipid II flippase FtsW [Gammaproteobacteria bacterium]
MSRQRIIKQAQALRTGKQAPHYDFWLISTVLFIIFFGLIIVASSSITIADRLYGEPLHFFWRQAIAVVLGLVFACVIIWIPLIFWERISIYLLLLGTFLLILVLVPGMGNEVNGSLRWINFGPVSLQASEPLKIFIITYLAGYMVRHGEKVKSSFAGFITPVGVVTLIAALLLLEPDYGTAVVLFATALGMLFMGGVPLGRFFAWVLTACIALGSLAVVSPYRMQRLTSFLDPWQDPFNSGFQLTQALIAFGRGDWFGVGLGSSVQKLFYLPEAHTDFVFAVLAEELGIFGSILVILLFFFIIWRAFVIAQIAEYLGKQFAAYMAYGIGLVIGMQAFVNIGVNMGILPTKGLTLPLMSYGGNSMVSSCVLIAMLVRIEFENHLSRKEETPRVIKNYAT